ncbi:MAG TPA: apolipoprotein N-acyltransferase, partial [Rhizobiales bacterium]|nr:apolipoprotein N-acyltransferase [Hyphomicrobiales bacterium]
AGAVRAEEGAGGEPTRYYNSVVEIDDGGVISGAVDKAHLVPGGEYLPLEGLFGRLGIDRMVAIPLSFSSGAGPRALAAPGGLTAAAFVCYEMIFPDLVAAGGNGADFIVTVTNDGWFGDTPGPYQHLRQAQIRAVEMQMPVLRAANTGISAVIDERGRILDALAIDARGTLDAVLTVPQPANRTSPSRLTGFLLVFGALALSLGLRARPRRRRD